MKDPSVLADRRNELFARKDKKQTTGSVKQSSPPRQHDTDHTTKPDTDRDTNPDTDRDTDRDTDDHVADVDPNADTDRSTDAGRPGEEESDDDQDIDIN